MKRFLDTPGRWAMRLWLRLEAWELMWWMRDLERSGLQDSLHLRACRRRMAEIEVRIAALQPPLSNRSIQA
jgi:hypothetical protein